MNLNKYLPLLIIILFFTLQGCSGNKSNVNEKDEVVARIGKDFAVTREDLKKYVVDWKYQYRYRVKSVAYKKALDGMIRDRLRVFDFFNRKLDEDQELMNKIGRYINYELINMYVDKEFADKYVNEKNEKKAYNQMSKEVIYDEAIIHIPQDAKKEVTDSLKAIALNIEQGLNNDFSIQDIIRIDTLKNIVVNNQKKMKWAQSIMDPVGNVVFNLKKGFTRVMTAYDGYHVVKVLDIKKIKIEPFEKVKDDIEKKLRNAYYNIINNDYDKFKLGLIDKSSIKWNQKALDQLIKWSKDEKFYAGAYKDTINNAVSHGRNFEIMSYNNGNVVDLKEYLRLLEQVVILSPNTILNSKNVKDFILEAVYDGDVVKDAKKLGLMKKLINPDTHDPIIADRLLYLYNTAVIDSSIPKATPEALHKFYESHKDSTFYQLKVVYIFARVYSDSAKAAADINKIRKGTPFEKVKDSWLVKMFIRERDGSLKAYRTDGGNYLAKAAFKLHLNECAGPIEYNDSTKGKQFAVIKCFKIIPEKQLTYNDVKGKRIEEAYTKYYRKKIAAEIDAKLKKKYNVKIFKNVLSEAIASK